MKKAEISPAVLERLISPPFPFKEAETTPPVVRAVLALTVIFPPLPAPPEAETSDPARVRPRGKRFESWGKGGSEKVLAIATTASKA
jgi:hypothetical protein